MNEPQRYNGRTFQADNEEGQKPDCLKLRKEAIVTEWRGQGRKRKGGQTVATHRSWGLVGSGKEHGFIFCEMESLKQQSETIHCKRIPLAAMWRKGCRDQSKSRILDGPNKSVTWWVAEVMEVGFWIYDRKREWV
jgi:hypothetical protein